ncbi:MAG: gamma-glutamylcyclotransferase [Verrucomicrobia bacterium]|nr:gamma-glutamylcyclotransferase [Verrucomicrobiota bacterium]
MLYFAYGSNMDWSRMRERCPSAQFVMKAMLPGFELQFTRTSRKLHCGTADIVPVAGGIVWGVVYHLVENDRQRLDEKEGVSIDAYRPEDLAVNGEGEANRRLEVFTYVVCSKESPRPKPSRTYLQHLLDGAEKWQLPEAYVRALRAVETLPASDAENAKALAREIASRAIQKRQALWDDLKHRLADCQSVDVYGSMQHMDFLSAVQHEVSRLSDVDRALLQKHITRPPDSREGWTYHDFITGQIFARAQNAARRM